MPWESEKIGGGAPPVRTDEGWLHIYHASGHHRGYSLFAALTCFEDPWRIVKRGSQPLLTPEASYERSGFFGDVVFSSGIVLEEDRLLIYYGASDETTCLAAAKLDELLSGL